MARRNLTPRQKRRRARRQYRRTPFKPLGSQFETWGDLEDRAGQLAQGEYRPQLNDIRYQIGREGRKHEGRLEDIDIGYKAADTRVGKAYNHLERSLANLMAARAGVTGASLGAMQGDMGDVESDAAALGVGAPATADFGVGAAAASQAGTDAVTQNIGQLEALVGGQRGLVALEGQQQAGRENALNRSLMTELKDRKRDIKGLIPAIVAKYRTQLEEGEASKANTRFQHRIAREQLEDVDKDRRLRKEELDLQRVTNSQNYQLQLKQLRQQAELARDQGNPGQADNIEAKIERMNNAGAFLDEFMAPKGKKEENHPNRVKQNRNPDQALHAMVTRFGLSKQVAASLLRTFWPAYAAPGTLGRKRWDRWIRRHTNIPETGGANTIEGGRGPGKGP